MILGRESDLPGSNMIPGIGWSGGNCYRREKPVESLAPAVKRKRQFKEHPEREF